MVTIALILSWFLSIMLTLLAFMILGMGGKIQFILMLAVAAVLCPPVGAWLKSSLGLAWWTRILVAGGLWGSMILTFVMNPAKSIYKSPKVREQLISIYDEKLAQWPVPFESRFLDTKYGKIHVIVSGPEDGYPVMLIHASGVGAWSWIFNVGALNTRYRTFAIDNIGEAGKNELNAPNNIPKTGPEIAAYYADIADKLGIEKSHVVGASIGGFISTNYAMYAPERVNRLVLLGSMGYGFTPKTVITMICAQGFPLKPIQNATFRWAFGGADHVAEAFGKWFRIVMKGMVPTPIAPKSLTSDDLKKVSCPTLAYFGTRDAVVGDAAKAKALASSIPNSTIQVVESGHLIGAELADRVNDEMMAFFAEDEKTNIKTSTRMH